MANVNKHPLLRGIEDQRRLSAKEGDRIEGAALEVEGTIATRATHVHTSLTASPIGRSDFRTSLLAGSGEKLQVSFVTSDLE